MALKGKQTIFGVDARNKKIVLGKLRISLPQSRAMRVLVGVGLMGGGFLGFLPVLGFWMFPLGLIVLSHDLAFVRRRRRRLAVWWSRRGDKRHPKES